MAVDAAPFATIAGTLSKSVGLPGLVQKIEAASTDASTGMEMVASRARLSPAGSKSYTVVSAPAGEEPRAWTVIMVSVANEPGTMFRVGPPGTCSTPPNGPIVAVVFCG